MMKHCVIDWHFLLTPSGLAKGTTWASVGQTTSSSIKAARRHVHGLTPGMYLCMQEFVLLLLLLRAE